MKDFFADATIGKILCLYTTNQSKTTIMRLSILILLSTFIVSSLNAQWEDNYIKLSENITTETKSITGFDKIEVSEDFEVFIKFSDAGEKVEIEANENLHELIQVRRVGSTLKIDTKSYSTRGYGKYGGTKERLIAYITAKQLTEIKADEDVVLELKDKYRGEKLTVILDEDCTLSGHIRVENLVVELDEDSVLEIEGKATNMKVDAHEDSMINGPDFVVGDLKIELSEDSEAKLTVNGDINLEATEDSYFHYRGSGEFTRKRLRGDSEVKTF